MKSEYPSGTEASQWFLSKEGSEVTIRRMLRLPVSRKRKSQRLPKSKFHHLTKQRDIEDFVIRLNGLDPTMERIKNRIDFNHAWISLELLEDYRVNYLRLHIPDSKRAHTHYVYLNKYVLNFFIEKLQLQNPVEWFRNQNLWGKYLLNRHDELLEDEKRIFERGKIRSGKTIKNTINELNRFISYLHLKRPDEVPLLKFKPISKPAFKEHEALRHMLGHVRVPHYIKPEHYDTIVAHLEKEKLPWRYAVYLAHDFGLRRSESLGLLKSDIRIDHLAVEQQCAGVTKDGRPIFRPLKGRITRFVPYWFSSPDKTYHAIQTAPKYHVHPDTLSSAFANFIRELDMPQYTFHDLRRTFVTNCVKRGIHHEDLRLAAGHVDVRTTYKYYVRDIRKLDSDVWTPQANGQL